MMKINKTEKNLQNKQTKLNKKIMKKLILIVLMTLSGIATFAGDSDPLKKILSAKNYAEAENLLKTNLSQLADNQEKAKAYNKLVDLAMQKVNKEAEVINNNQLAKVQHKDEVPFDTIGYYDAIYKAISAAVECDKYDQMPNAKGKIRAKFQKNNANRLANYRLQLINGGQNAASGNDTKTAYKNFSLYVETANHNLFKDLIKQQGDSYLGEVARVAAIYAFQEKDLDAANRFCDIALKDTASYKEALNLKTYLLTQGLKTREDSINSAKKLKEFYDTQNGNDQVFASLASIYSGLDMKAELKSLIDLKMSQDPNSFTAWFVKGQLEMNSRNWDEAIKSFKKAASIKDDNALLFTYLGFCINSKAQDLSSESDQKKLYSESLGYLEKSRQLDPNRESANWAYPLYQSYYSLYGAEDSRTKEMENIIKTQ